MNQSKFNNVRPNLSLPMVSIISNTTISGNVTNVALTTKKYMKQLHGSSEGHGL